ncbi:MAG: hypothetical protein GTN76_03215 [Candidatus Aenigmarchaeota archaeon]|nr:hypothetical protein [Candidatus Aenigmarchaeota archaeon]
MKRASRPFKRDSLNEQVFFLILDSGEIYAENILKKMGAKSKREKDSVYVALARMKKRELVTVTSYGTYKLTRKGKNLSTRLK